MLLVGDSTGVGVVADTPEHSIGGLLAAAFPGVQIDNRRHPFGDGASGTWFAADGVHPSRASYRYCFDHLMRHADLRAWLTPERTAR